MTTKTTPKAKQPSQAVKKKLTDLTGRMCRWPHGDPQNDDFHFCGQKTDAEHPYCPDHWEQAHRNSGKSSSAA